jgi:hypothetical protein
LRHEIQSGLGLLGETSEYHGDMIARVLVPRATDNNATTVHNAISRGSNCKGHFCPLGEGGWAAKLYATTMDNHGITGEGQQRLSALNYYLFVGKTIRESSSRAHITGSV